MAPNVVGHFLRSETYLEYSLAKDFGEDHTSIMDLSPLWKHVVHEVYDDSLAIVKVVHCYIELWSTTILLEYGVNLRWKATVLVTDKTIPNGPNGIHNFSTKIFCKLLEL